MDLSFVIPAHNNANLLAKTLAGLCVQRKHRLDWEVIVVDNNSSDMSMSKVHSKYRTKLPIRLILQPQLPHPFALCNARNAGIRLAKGGWIAVIDADTIPNRSYLQTFEKYLRTLKDEKVICTSERRFIDTSEVNDMHISNNPDMIMALPSAKSPSNYGLDVDRRFPDLYHLSTTEHPWDYMHGCNTIFRKEAALQIGGYDEEYDGRWGFEDIEFAYRMIAENGCRPVYVEGMHVYHQDLPGGDDKSDRNDKSSNPNWARICKKIPGYKDFKTARYKKQSTAIKT